MTKLLALKNAYLNNEEGATAIEYALLAAGIALVIIGGVFAFGEELNAMFEGLGGKLEGPE